MSFFHRIKIIVLSVTITAFFILNIASASAEPIRVAIVPFEIHAAEDLSFLQEGIFDMLSSRITWDEKVTVVDEDEISKALESHKVIYNENQARELGTAVAADYVLYGSLTVFGDSVSMDAKMVDVTAQKPTMPFYKQTKGMADVIPKIDTFASDINEKVFLRGIAVASAVAVPVVATTAAPDAYAHPDKLTIEKEPVTSPFVPVIVAEEADPAKADIAGTSFVKIEEEQALGGDFWKSRDFDERFCGISSGDIDKDGKIETVVLTNKMLYIFRGEQGKFFKVVEFDINRNKRPVGIDVADINQNGFPEIFVTCLNSQRNRMSSFILEYDGNSLQTVSDKTPWYYRVARGVDQSLILLGQKQRGDDPYLSEFVTLTWSGNDYNEASSLIKSNRINLLGATLGDARNDITNTIVAFDSSSKLNLIDPEKGSEYWKGSERYGSSIRYFTDQSGTETRITYLPMRTLIIDIDGDGKNEVVVVKKKEMAKNLLDQFRWFTDSKIVLLNWNGLGLKESRETQEISGNMSDFVVADFDNDGKDELVATVIIKEGDLIGTTPKSTIVSYDL
ncbi:MAG: VCBS repeat-containing protein [Desulfobacterales bacterium]|nr:VCBS repeat-containing protein [Desulfobacterales bacterium]